MNSASPTPLALVPPAQVSVVASVDVPTDDAGRLMALGLCVGRKVEVVKQGDPLIIKVIGSRIGLSGRLAEMIWVRPAGDSLPIAHAG